MGFRSALYRSWEWETSEKKGSNTKPKPVTSRVSEKSVVKF